MTNQRKGKSESLISKRTHKEGETEEHSDVHQADPL